MEENKIWFSKSRVETFCDGVFAIIITILVLEIKVPAIQNRTDVNELMASLLAIVPKFLSWIISFFMVCIIWVNHHRIFESISRITHRLFWYNAFLLLCCAYIPFPTALMGDYPQNPLSFCIFGIVMGMMGLGFTLIRWTVVKEKLIVNTDHALKFKKDNLKSFIYGCLLYFIGAGLTWVHPIFAIIIFCFIPFYFIFFASEQEKI
jgi:uncharacterized membrane protein